MAPVMSAASESSAVGAAHGELSSVPVIFQLVDPPVALGRGIHERGHHRLDKADPSGDRRHSVESLTDCPEFQQCAVTMLGYGGNGCSEPHGSQANSALNRAILAVSGLGGKRTLCSLGCGNELK